MFSGGTDGSVSARDIPSLHTKLTLGKNLFVSRNISTWGERVTPA